MRLLKLEDMYGKETYINADRVNYIGQHGLGVTVIHFGASDETVSVKMEPAVVASMLLNAGKLSQTA